MSKWPKEKKRFKRDTYPGQRWNMGDFILWHGCKENSGVCWESEIGRGRPSWNIQDPAIISENFGWSVDIFCGGIDNLCRHHDYNIAVMGCASGKELARYWLHGQHVLAAGRKMSKSLHNIVYPEDLIKQGYSWDQIRFYLLSKQYREKINLRMEAVREESSRLDELKAILKDLTSPGEDSEAVPPDGEVGRLIDDLTASFEAGMNEDLNTPSAVEGLFGDLRRLHRLHKAGRIGKVQTRTIEERLRKIDSVLQFLF